MTAISVVPPPISNHVARGLGNRQPRADSRHHGLFHQVHFAGLGAIRRVFHGALFHLRNLARHADHNPRVHQHLAVVRLLDKVVEHFFRDFEVRDHAVFHGLDGHDVARCAPQHLLGVLAHGLHFAGVFVDRDDGRLVHHDALARGVHQRVGGAQIDGQIAGKHAKERAQAMRSRRARGITVQGHWKFEFTSKDYCTARAPRSHGSAGPRPLPRPPFDSPAWKWRPPKGETRETTLVSDSRMIWGAFPAQSRARQCIIRPSRTRHFIKA